MCYLDPRGQPGKLFKGVRGRVFLSGKVTQTCTAYVVNALQCDQMVWSKFRQVFGKSSQKSSQNQNKF